MENKTVKAAILGAGTVGSGVYALAGMLSDEMVQKTGGSLEIKKVLVRDTKKERDGIPGELLTDCWNDILTDNEIQIIIGSWAESSPQGPILPKQFSLESK